MKTLQPTKEQERADFLASIIITAVEGGCLQFQFREYRYEEDKETGLMSNACVLARDWEREHPKNWTHISPAQINTALAKFKSRRASEELSAHDSYIAQINAAERINDGGAIDGELADIIFQVAINNLVIFG